MVRLCGLWLEKNGDGKTMLKGSLGSGRLVILPNYHKENDRQPDYVVYVDQKEQRNAEPQNIPDIQD